MLQAIVRQQAIAERAKAKRAERAKRRRAGFKAVK
jgi:hypothetical protein